MPKIIENPQAIILEHAEKILESKGYEALSMRAIARSCGIATGTIYNYFPTKKELLLQLMTDYWEKHFAVIDQLAAGDDELFIKLKKIFEVMENFVTRFREVWTGMRQENNNAVQTEDIHRNHDSMQRLTEKVGVILALEAERMPDAFQYPLPIPELADFIIQNHLAICHMGNLRYEAWERILKKVLA